MKASGSLRKNFYREQRGAPTLARFSRNTTVSKGYSGRKMMAGSESVIVQNIEKGSGVTVLQGDASMTDELKVWDPVIADTSAALDQVDGMGGVVGSDVGFVIGPAQPAKGIRKRDGFLKMAAQKMVTVGGPSNLNDGATQSLVVDRVGPVKIPGSVKGGSGDASSSKSERKVWVRKVRATGNGDFGGELKVVQGKRRGVLVAVGEDSVVKKRKVTVESGDTAVGCVTKNEVCLENQAVGLVTQVGVSATEEFEKLLAGRSSSARRSL
ncbi:hypothetical protein Q3G72_020957 [Acer saccharum]|nr:hypothetical protein Q3G72_020957 [Acer saccharum]